MADTFLVLGDQLSFDVAPWAEFSSDTVILMIESAELIDQARHVTRVSLYLAAMRAFADQVVERGFTIDYRKSTNFSAGVREHREAFTPDRSSSAWASRY